MYLPHCGAEYTALLLHAAVLDVKCSLPGDVRVRACFSRHADAIIDVQARQGLTH